MRGTVIVVDRHAVHVIPRSEVRFVEVGSFGTDGWRLSYQLAGSARDRSIEWAGESRPPTLKDKVQIGEYNSMAAEYVLAVVTRGHRDVHLERRSDNVFAVRSGLIEDDAKVAVCRKFIAELAAKALKTIVGSLDDEHRQVLREIHAAARDLVLPDWFPIQEDPR